MTFHISSSEELSSPAFYRHVQWNGSDELETYLSDLRLSPVRFSWLGLGCHLSGIDPEPLTTLTPENVSQLSLLLSQAMRKAPFNKLIKYARTASRLQEV